jgi:hypothetical protein
MGSPPRMMASSKAIRKFMRNNDPLQLNASLLDQDKNGDKIESIVEVMRYDHGCQAAIIDVVNGHDEPI